jgi:hypothetical protein
MCFRLGRKSRAVHVHFFGRCASGLRMRGQSNVILVVHGHPMNPEDEEYTGHGNRSNGQSGGSKKEIILIKNGGKGDGPAGATAGRGRRKKTER